MGRFFFILLVVALAVVAAWKFIPVNVPFYREITDTKGQAIKGEVIGKTKTEITVINEETGQRSDISFSKLSVKDRLYLLRVRKQDPPPLEVPFERELTDSNGRKIVARIIGKSSSAVTVIVKKTNQRYDIPIAKLSAADARFMTKVKNRQAPSPEETLEVPYVQRRLKEIDELQKKADILLIQINSGTLNNMVEKNQRDQLSNVVKEIKVLETAIETYKWRNKMDRGETGVR